MVHFRPLRESFRIWPQTSARTGRAFACVRVPGLAPSTFPRLRAGCFPRPRAGRAADGQSDTYHSCNAPRTSSPWLASLTCCRACGQSAWSKIRSGTHRFWSKLHPDFFSSGQILTRVKIGQILTRVKIGQILTRVKIRRSKSDGQNPTVKIRRSKSDGQNLTVKIRRSKSDGQAAGA